MTATVNNPTAGSLQGNVVSTTTNVTTKRVTFTPSNTEPALDSNLAPMHCH